MLWTPHTQSDPAPLGLTSECTAGHLQVSRGLFNIVWHWLGEHIHMIMLSADLDTSNSRRSTAYCIQSSAVSRCRAFPKPMRWLSAIVACVPTYERMRRSSPTSWPKDFKPSLSKPSWRHTVQRLPLRCQNYLRDQDLRKHIELGKHFLGEPMACNLPDMFELHSCRHLPKLVVINNYAELCDQFSAARAAGHTWQQTRGTASSSSKASLGQHCLCTRPSPIPARTWAA